jgi:hypothetical protein
MYGSSLIIAELAGFSTIDTTPDDGTALADGLLTGLPSRSSPEVSGKPTVSEGIQEVRLRVARDGGRVWPYSAADVSTESAR